MQAKPPARNSRSGVVSILIFWLTLLLWLAESTFLESHIASLSEPVERGLLIVTLVLPSILGALLGGAGLIKQEENRLWATLGLILNALQTLHFSCVLALAG